MNMENKVVDNLVKLKEYLEVVEGNNIKMNTYNVCISREGKVTNKNIDFPDMPGIYVFYSDEYNVFNEKWLDFKEKYQKVPRINEDRIVTSQEGSRVMYVGRKLEKISTRLNQHLSVKSDTTSTYAMYLGSFAKYVDKELRFEIRTFSFNSDLEKVNQNIVISALEAMLHTELQPLIGSSR